MAKAKNREVLPDGNSSLRAIRTPDDLGGLVRGRRKILGLNQTQVAEQAGVGRRFLVELEDGKPTAQIGKILRVLAALGISITGLYE